MQVAYVPVPKDLNAVKTKVLFNLTKRQLVCFGSGAAVGVPLFFLLRQSLSNSAAAICMIVVMLPFFLFALYEKNGLPLEKIIKNIVQVCSIRPKVRPYETDNFYAVLQRQDILDKEVYRIVSGKTKLSRADRKQIEAAIAKAKTQTNGISRRRIPFPFSGCSRTVSAG